MPYQRNVPNAGQSPGLFPSQGNDNFTRLKTIVGANHKFNDSAATDDGYHQIIKCLPVAPGDVPNDATVGQAFVSTADSTNQLWHKDSLNRLFQITPAIPTYAAVNFEGGGGGTTIRYQQNVSSVTRVSEGVYIVNYTVNLPSINYVVVATAMRSNTNGMFVEVYPGTYTDSVKVNSVKIRTVSRDSGDERDARAVFLMCCGG